MKGQGGSPGLGKGKRESRKAPGIFKINEGSRDQKRKKEKPIIIIASW